MQRVAPARINVKLCHVDQLGDQRQVADRDRAHTGPTGQLPRGGQACDAGAHDSDERTGVAGLIAAKSHAARFADRDRVETNWGGTEAVGRCVPTTSRVDSREQP